MNIQNYIGCTPLISCKEVFQLSSSSSSYFQVEKFVPIFIYKINLSSIINILKVNIIGIYILKATSYHLQGNLEIDTLSTIFIFYDAQLGRFICYDQTF